MPYIKKEERKEINEFLHPLIKSLKTPGQRNYAVSMIMWLTAPPSYEGLSQAIADLECAKLEFFRRLLASYETHKIMENGDLIELPNQEGEESEGSGQDSDKGSGGNPGVRSETVTGQGPIGTGGASSEAGTSAPITDVRHASDREDKSETAGGTPVIDKRRVK